MDMVLKRILDVCSDRNINERTVLIDLGISTSFFTEWKKGKIKTPSYDKISRIADYLNVSIDYIVKGTELSSIKENNNLLEDELELLSLYREFDIKEKYKILGMLEMKLMMYKENKKITSSSSPQENNKGELTA